MTAPFTVTITGDNLARGLRPSKRVHRNTQYLQECEGAVGRDGTLQSLDQLTRVATSAITDGFPYPQIFAFTNLIIVCSQTKIYEWVEDALVLKLTVTGGSPWSAVDFFDYVYMSNNKVAVVRDYNSKTFALTTDLPVATTICNFNGQVLIGVAEGPMRMTIQSGSFVITGSDATLTAS